MGAKIMAEENILDIKRLKITCNNCKSEITFDIDAPNKHRPIYICPVCGGQFGIDPENDTIERAKLLIESAKSVKNATFTFLCRKEEIQVKR